MFWEVPEASAHDSDPKSSRKPRTYASSKEFWKLLECAGELGSVAWLAGTVASTVAADVSRGYQTSLGKSWAVCWNCLEPWGSRRVAATKGCSRLGNV